MLVCQFSPKSVRIVSTAAVKWCVAADITTLHLVIFAGHIDCWIVSLRITDGINALSKTMLTLQTLPFP